jgi:hypothetical protein
MFQRDAAPGMLPFYRKVRGPPFRPDLLPLTQLVRSQYIHLSDLVTVPVIF